MIKTRVKLIFLHESTPRLLD